MNTPCTGHAAESERDEWMAEVERLVDACVDAGRKWLTESTSVAEREARAALLDHIRRGVPDHIRDATEMVQPVELPEPDTSDIAGYTPHALRTYGDAREAAGYARGLKEADKLAHTLAMCRETFKKYADMHSEKGTDEGREKAAANMRIVSICDAALRGEVKP